MILVTF